MYDFCLFYIIFSPRSAMAKRASDNSKLYQGMGYNFPWESGFSGNELAPGCPADPQCNWRKMFTTAAISWGIRQYYSATRDRDYMINPLYNGCDMTREIARFFSNQAIYNPNIARYDMYSKYIVRQLNNNCICIRQ